MGSRGLCFQKASRRSTEIRLEYKERSSCRLCSLHHVSYTTCGNEKKPTKKHDEALILHYKLLESRPFRDGKSFWWCVSVSVQPRLSHGIAVLVDINSVGVGQEESDLTQVSCNHRNSSFLIDQPLHLDLSPSMS